MYGAVRRVSLPMFRLLLQDASPGYTERDHVSHALSSALSRYSHCFDYLGVKQLKKSAVGNLLTAHFFNCFSLFHSFILRLAAVAFSVEKVFDLRRESRHANRPITEAHARNFRKNLNYLRLYRFDKTGSATQHVKNCPTPFEDVRS